MRGKTMAIMLLLIAAAALVGGNKFAGVKEDLARQRETIAAQWSSVEAALERRADVIPHLIEPVKKGIDDGVLRELSATRAKLASAREPEEKIRANRELSVALGKLMSQCETDGRVRQSGAFRLLQEELAVREDEIANERFQYNNALEHYNARMQRFPDNVVASLAGFTRNDAYFGTGPAQ